MVSPLLTSFANLPMEPHEVRAAPDPSVVPKRVALLNVDQNVASQAQFQGVIEYLRETGQNWQFYGSSDHAAFPSGRLQQWAGDGILGNINSESDLSAALASGRPLVSVGGLLGMPPQFPCVTVDNRAVGALAASHLMATGLGNYAFLATQRYWYATEREFGFREQLGKQDYQVSSLYLEGESLTGHQDHRLLQWLASLPTPVGVFCATDAEALRVLRAARQLCRRVPEDFALIGCNDNPLLCEFGPVTLSSISLPHELIGYQGAALLAHLMAGIQTNPGTLLVPPRAVVARASTDLLVGIDADVMKAIRFIRQNACRGIRIQDVLSQVSLSRRSLENHVKRAIGRTPYDEILRLRIERAKKLLTSTALPLADVAKRSGFSDARQLSLTFRSKLDVTPTQYREHAPGMAPPAFVQA